MTDQPLPASDDEEAVAALLAVLRAQGAGEVRVSSTTLGRPAGTTPRAYRRRGRHGPEWVFPHASIEAAGVRQPGPPVVAPAPDRRHAWQGAPGSRRPAGVVVVALLVALLAIVGLVAWVAGGDGDPAETDAVTTLVADLTDPGDRVGYVGARAVGLLPSDRVPVRLMTATDLDGAPRVIVTVSPGGAPSELVTTLAGSATDVLEVERDIGTVRVFDRTAEPSPASSPPPTAGPPAVADPAPAPTTPPPPFAAPEASPAPVPAASGEVREVTVRPGEHFWKLAEDVASASLGRRPTDGEVVPVWLEIIELNQDILIEPGNPNLLLAGQTVQLPSG